jgi:multidrug efflux pump subunit AcrA (membrane-fusion protein)
MKFQFVRSRLPSRRGWCLLILLVVALAGLASGSRWLPAVNQLAASTVGSWLGQRHGAATGHDGHEELHPDDEHGHPCEAAGAHSDHDDADEHDTHHTHADAAGQPAEADHDHEEASAVRLSPTAQDNVGLKLAKVELRTFERTIHVPAMVVERPGRSAMQVAAPLTGVVTRIWPLQGETVTPGQPLFDLRLMHEEVVEAQAAFLRTAEELDVVKRELARLQKVAEGGVIPGKTVLERQYEQQKLEGVFRAHRQRLLLHGLSTTQVDEIAAQRTLLGELTIRVPEPRDGESESEGEDSAPLLQIQELKVSPGQHVDAGEALCVLTDHARLYIQGKAFEQDAAVLEEVANHDRRVTAVVEGPARERQLIPDLPIAYVANKVEPESRAILFYVELRNQMVRQQERPDGRRFSSWQFKPGQRLELLIPVERWTDRIVLPLGAVVQDGPESYVFEQNNGHFDRRAVRVEYRDQDSAVIANDGTLGLGKMVIVSGTYQVHLSMKNKAGGGADPHAGHNH